MSKLVKVRFLKSPVGKYHVVGRPGAFGVVPADLFDQMAEEGYVEAATRDEKKDEKPVQRATSKKRSRSRKATGKGQKT